MFSLNDWEFSVIIKNGFLLTYQKIRYTFGPRISLVSKPN